MTTSIDVILGQCIVAIQHGEMTLAECLQRYPQHSKELTLLLKTWQDLTTAPAVSPSPDFRRVAKSRLQIRLPVQQPVTFLDRLSQTWLKLTIPSRVRTRKGRVRPKKPVFEHKGPSDPSPPGTELQYLDRGRGKS